MTKKAEIHVHLDASLKKQIERFATKNSRSVNMQILHYIKDGLKHDEAYHADRR
jgi:hypothetical protein